MGLGSPNKICNLILSSFLSQDAKKVSHRGFGFVTFADEASAGRVARLRHYLFGREVAFWSQMVLMFISKECQVFKVGWVSWI